MVAGNRKQEQKEDKTMMRLLMAGDGHEYKAETAVGLIDQIKGMHWNAGENATAEDYIKTQEDTYRRILGKEMELPDGDTEDRERAMFQKIAEDTGAWEYNEGREAE